MNAYFDLCRQFLGTWYGAVIVAALLYFLLFHKPVKKYLAKRKERKTARADEQAAETDKG